MSDTVRVRARSTILDLVYGEVADLELTGQVDALLRSGKLELVLDDAVDEGAVLRHRAALAGLRVDGRWGLERLRVEVEHAEGSS